MLEYKQYGDKNSKYVMFMLHGYGDDENGYIELAKHLRLDYNFYAIRAPKELEFGGFSWYYIPWEEKITESVLKKVYSDIEESVNLIQNTINYIIEENNLQEAKKILLGFSQGSVMSFYLADKIQWNKIISLSGYITQAEKIVEINRKAQQAGTQIIFMYDDNDQVVNKTRTLGALIGEEIKELFEKNELSLEYRRTHYGHGIGPDTLEYIHQFLKN